MDELFKSVVVQICVFGAAVYVLSFLTRRGLETGFSCLKRMPEDEHKPYPNALARWWNEFILYLLPPAWGVGVAFFIRKTALFPDSFREWQTAVVFGIAFGSMCGLLYKLLKKIVAGKAGAAGGTTTDDVAILATPGPDPAPAPDPKPADKP